jgi:hypothetical protein
MRSSKLTKLDETDAAVGENWYGKMKHSKETCFIVTPFTSPTLSGLRSNQSHCIAKLVTAYLSFGMSLQDTLQIIQNVRFTNYDLGGMKMADNKRQYDLQCQ